MATQLRNLVVTICLLVVSFATLTDSSRTRRNAVTCGVAKASTGLIVRGINIRRGEFPWLVAIMHTETRPPKFACAGTLISPTFVVSVAHCFKWKSSTEIVSHRDVVALFGVHRLDDEYEVDRQNLIPLEIIIHEDWNPYDDNYDADLSLLQFEPGKINLNSPYINPICIWNSKEYSLPNEGVVLGWGHNLYSEKRHENVPRFTKVTVMSNEECLLEQPHLAEMSSLRTFCAGNKKNSGVCKGDSGGGLFVKIDEIFFLKGIVSTALVDFVNDFKCDIVNNAVYTDIHQFTDWIANKTQHTFSSSVKVLKKVFCIFRLRDSYHHARRVETCLIDSMIDSDFVAVGSKVHASVLSFSVSYKPSVKFLPRYIGKTLPKLEELTSHHCNLSIIRSFYFENMLRVQFIDISFNEIAMIDKNSFKDLFAVKYMFVGNNKIKTLDRDLFRTMASLKNLDLAHNQINSLDPTMFEIPGGKLLEVNLLGNVCLNKTYELKEFEDLEQDIISYCQPD